MKRASFLGWLALASCAVSLPASAQGFPDKPITFIVGYPAGARTDVMARIVADELTSRFKQRVLVDNRAGATGMIGVSAVALSPGDGYTLLVAPNTVYMAPFVMGSVAPKDYSVSDLVPVIQLSRGSLILVTNSNLHIKSAKEFVSYANTKSGGATYATPGSGSPMHIVGELLKRVSGAKMTQIPYKGSAPALTDLLGGQVDALFGTLGSLVPRLQDGSLTAIGITQETRSTLMPSIPTFAEQGMAGVDMDTWYGILAPKGTPVEVVERLNKEINEVMAMPEVKRKFKEQWEIPVGGSAQAFASIIKGNTRDYGELIKQLKITAE